MQIIKGKNKIANYIYAMAFLLQTLVMVGGYGAWELPYRGRVLQAAFVLFCLKILMTEYSKAEWISMILLGILGCVSYFATGEEYVVSIIVMIFASKSVKIQKYLKMTLLLALLVSALNAVLSVFGIGGMMVDVRDYGRGGIESRWCLGFNHANNLHGTYWYLLALLFAIYFARITWKHYIVLTVFNILLYFLTLSKGGFIAGQLLICCCFVLKKWEKIRYSTWIYLLGLFALAGVVAISFFSVLIPWNESAILQLLDRMFTGRINLAYQGAPIANWQLFAGGGEIGVVDNGWITVFFQYGYIIGFVYILFQLYLLFKCYQKKDGVNLVLLTTNTFYTFMEATYTMNNAYYLCNISFIVAMIMMGEKHESE